MGAKKELAEDEEDTITEIEINILNHFLTMLRKRLTEAWKPVATMNFILETQDNNPNNTMLVGSNEIVILAVLEFAIESSKGLINLCYPKSYIESLLATGAMSRIMAETKIKKTRNEDINSLIAGSKVKCEAIMAKTNFIFHDLLKLKNDDVIVFSQPINTIKGSFTFNNKNKFQIDFGSTNNRKSVKLISNIDDEHHETVQKLRDLATLRADARQAAKDEVMRIMHDESEEV
jgi:flagellar motor switch protein FliM